jgi:hypothetical protein
VFRKFSPNFLVAHSHQNQCCVLVWDSFADFHCSKVLGLRRVFILSSAVRDAEMLDLRLTEFHELFIELRQCF